MKKGEWAALAVPGARFALRVTPKASRDDLRRVDGIFLVRVTAAAEGGKANKAVLKLLARGLGVPVTRLTILRGDSGRDKLVKLV